MGFLGDIGGFISDAFGGAADFIGDATNFIGEGALAPWKWQIDAIESIGDRLGIKEIRNIGNEGGEFIRNPIVENLAGAITTAAVGNWAAPYIQSYMIESFPSMSSYLTPAAASNDAMGTFRVLDAASTGANFAGTPYAATAASLTPSMLDSLTDAATGQAKRFAVDEGLNLGLNEFVIKPYQEKLAGLLAGLNATAPTLRNYSYTPKDMMIVMPEILAASTPVGVTPSATPVPNMASGLMGDNYYLKNYRDYGTVPRPSLTPEEV